MITQVEKSFASIFSDAAHPTCASPASPWQSGRCLAPCPASNPSTPCQLHAHGESATRGQTRSGRGGESSGQRVPSSVAIAATALSHAPSLVASMKGRKACATEVEISWAALGQTTSAGRSAGAVEGRSCHAAAWCLARACSWRCDGAIKAQPTARGCRSAPRSRRWPARAARSRSIAASRPRSPKQGNPGGRLTTRGLWGALSESIGDPYP